MQDPAIVPSSRRQRLIPIAVNYVLVVGMIASFTISFVHFIGVMTSGWDGGFLVGASILIAIEAMVSNFLRQDTTVFSLNWFMQYVSEIIFVFLLLKFFLIMNQLGPGSVLSPSFWVALPNQDFFDTRLVISVFYSIFVWIVSTRYAEYLKELEEDPDVIAQKKLGLLGSDLDQTRRQMITMVFGIGALMLVMAALAKVDYSFLGIQTLQAPSRLAPLVFYFIFGLAVIAQTRYATLRVRWYLGDFQVGSHMALRWAIYCLVLFLIIGFLSIILPTRYSVGLLDILRTGIGWLNILIGLIGGLLLAPFLFLSQWFASLFNTPADIPSPTPIPSQLPTPAAGSPPVNPADWLLSFIYWALLIGVVGFSLVYYFRTRLRLAGGFDNLSVFLWWQSFRKWFARLFKRVNQSLARTWESGMNRLRPLRENVVKISQRFPFIANLKPKIQIRQLYLHMVDMLGQSGHPRLPAQTPYEYAQDVRDDFPGVTTEVDQLTQGFIEARYTPHEIDANTAAALEQAFEKIQNSLTLPTSPSDTP